MPSQVLAPPGLWGVAPGLQPPAPHADPTLAASRAVYAFNRAGVSLPTCSCDFIDPCSRDGVVALVLQTPKKVSGTPWEEYLTTVYGEAPPADFDLSSLETFYSGLLPIRQDCKANASAPSCSTDVCASWWPEPPPTPAAVKAAAKDRAMMRMRTAPGDHNKEEVIMLQRAAKERRAVPERAWVEVLRHAVPAGSNHTEGTNEYGCWVYPSVGSGVFINVGSTKAWGNRNIASGEVGVPLKGVPAITRETRFAQHAASLRYDSYQLVRSITSASQPPLHEIVLVGDSCMHAPEMLTSPCVPVPMRTGFGAARQCRCDERSPMINCRAGRSVKVDETSEAMEKLQRISNGSPATGPISLRDPW